MTSQYRYILISGVVGFLLAASGAAGQEDPGGSPGSRDGDPVQRPLTLREAVDDALSRNGDLEAARARTDADRARSRQASSFLFPTLGVEAGTVRSNDPVAVFGTKLRQEAFTQGDFALDALNRPDPVTDWTAGGGVRWRILDPSAWAGREAARLGARASELGLERRSQATAFQARILYLGALAADARVDAARRALEAARASREIVRRSRNQGMLTDADVLQADAEVAGARAALADARRSRYEARSRLGAHLGWPADTLPRPTDDLLEQEAAGASGAGLSTPDRRVSDRPDLRALGRAAEAADARVSQAVRSRLPSVETFGRISTHAADLSGDRAANWTLGVQLSWPAFTGFAREGAVDEARALRRAARAEHAQRLREARAGVEEARRAVEAAREGAEAARAAAEAAQEARRLVRRRFEEGLATTARLLQADARAADMESRAIGARAALRIADARLDFELGRTVVDQ